MSQPVDFTNVRNVLILRTDHLGDLLLSTPLIRKLRTALPDRRFTLVASPANAQALAGWDAIDEILVFDARWPLAQKWRFLQELWLTRWDLCLTLSPRTISTSSAACRERRSGPDWCTRGGFWCACSVQFG